MWDAPKPTSGRERQTSLLRPARDGRRRGHGKARPRGQRGRRRRVRTVAALARGTAEHVYLLNAFMPMLLSREALAHFDEGGVIVNISAVVAERPQPGMAAYSASKAALTAFDAGLAREARLGGPRYRRPSAPYRDRPCRPGDRRTAPRLPTGLDPDAGRVDRAGDRRRRDRPSQRAVLTGPRRRLGGSTSRRPVAARDRTRVPSAPLRAGGHPARGPNDPRPRHASCAASRAASSLATS